MNRSPVDHIARGARYTPEALALTGAGERLTYADLDHRIDQTAAWFLNELGLKRGDRVAFLAENHPVFFELLFACLRTGVILAPLNFRLSRAELSGILGICRPRLLLVGQSYEATAAKLSWEYGDEPSPIRCRLDELYSGREAMIRGGDLRGTQMEEAACLLFTSGTTGFPKAAVLPARQLFWNAVNTGLAFKLSRDDSTVLYTPLFHTGAINVLAMPLFQCGGAVHVHLGFDPVAVVETVEREGVTTLFGVPTTFRMLADQEGFLDTASRYLRLCLCGGAPLPVALINRYTEADVVLTQGFGMTEVGPNCFFLPPQAALERAGSVGKPMPYCDARIMVGEREALVDEVGELQLSGPHVCTGYFENPEATNAALTDGWFKTGDLVRRDADGWFYVAGRQKDMFISGGENVYPAEVENTLVGHPAVVECGVVPVPDERWGEVGVAFVVASEGDLEASSLSLWLRERLARYKVPKHILLRGPLPRNSSGKVVKAELLEEAKSHVA